MILIISPRQTRAAILSALHGSFAMTRQDSVNLQFDLDAAQLMRFKYALRNAVDVTRLVYVNTEAGLVELDRVKTVADFANQNSLPLVLASAYSLLGEDQCGDFLRSAAGYIEGIVPQHFIIGRAQFENVQFSLIADQINGITRASPAAARRSSRSRGKMLPPILQSVWIGPASEVEAALNEVQADTDAEGQFRLEVPEGTLCFLGSAAEVLVTSRMYHFRRGRKRKLVLLLKKMRPQQKPRIEFGNDD